MMGAKLNGWLAVLCFLCSCMVTWGCSGTEGGNEMEQEAPAGEANYAPWPMHAVDSRFRGANALSPGDVNQDGFDDYVTNYEFDQRFVISFHPGATGNVRQPWPTVVAWMPRPLANGNGVNPEH